MNMLSLTLLTLTLVAPPMEWQKDYDEAAKLAAESRKDLLIHFRQDGRLDPVFTSPELRGSLDKFVCLQVPLDYEHQGKKLINQTALADMMGRPGFAVISMHDPKLPSYLNAISVHPLVTSRYRWVPAYGVDEVKYILELPATATLSQRSMLYAVAVHPERPMSVRGTWQPAFVAHAQRHSAEQAVMQNQHHANLVGVMGMLEQQSGFGLSNASEVVAESWGAFVGGGNVLEASFSCVDAWRQSSGHWGAVSRYHRYFGYDVARGANGTWYATGIFSD